MASKVFDFGERLMTAARDALRRHLHDELPLFGVIAIASLTPWEFGRALNPSNADCPLLKLPNEILHAVADDLGVRDTLRLRVTCKMLNKIIPAPTYNDLGQLEEFLRNKPQLNFLCQSCGKFRPEYTFQDQWVSYQSGRKHKCSQCRMCAEYAEAGYSERFRLEATEMVDLIQRYMDSVKKTARLLGPWLAEDFWVLDEWEVFEGKDKENRHRLPHPWRLVLTNYPLGVCTVCRAKAPRAKQIQPATLEMLQLRVREDKTKALYKNLGTCLFCLRKSQHET